MSFGEAYAGLCGKSGLKPRAELLNEQKPTIMKLNGNCRERFENKLVDSELATILQAAEESSAPLEHMDLSYNFLSDAACDALAAFLRKNDTLLSLNLAFNEIGGMPARTLSNSLTVNYTLTELNLQGNDIGDEGGVAVAAMMKSNTTIYSVNLASCGIGINALVGIATAVQQHPSLTVLNIDKPLLRSQQEKLSTIQHLGEMIRLNTTLLTLSMARFDLTDDMLESLVHPFIQNGGLRNINLSSNPLSPGAGELLTRILRKRGDFAELNLSSCRLSEDGACELAQALRSHPSLTKLNLCNNKIGERGLTAIATMLKYNDTISCLTLWGNLFTDKACEKLFAIKSRLDSLTLKDFDFNVVDDRPQAFCTDL